MFLRESEGVYQFGQRKVYIKVEKGCNVLVKVGGGYMSVSDFIDEFQKSEVERQKRNDVYARFKAKMQI